ncbi:hypothetical protein C8Q75DRAFT_570650 [Abortiporus biennis]|nr:hypothetical protein C8Q75DRAFT_570650 [Abortiporus biennis]
MQDVSDGCLDTDLLRYSGVCRYWRDTMMISPQLWCRVIMHGKSTRFIKYLDLKISRSSSHNLKLVILRLTDLTTGWLSCMPVEVFNRLSWVEFSDRVEFPPDIAIRLISRTLPSLKHICISSSKLRRRMGSADISRISHLIHSNAPRINSFTLRNAGTLPEALNLHVLSGLTALNLDFTEVLTKRSILAMFQILVVNNSLETLHINCKKAHYKYRDVVPISRDDSSPVLAITPPTEVPTPVVLSRLRSIHLLHCTGVFIHRVLDKLELPYGCLIDVFPTILRGEAVDRFDIRNLLPKRYLNKSVCPHTWHTIQYPNRHFFSKFNVTGSRDN